MRVAVVGGGFYGVMAALDAAKHKSVKEVVIYERDSKLLSGAARLNQGRLHKGYHYPRSPETIQQSLEGFDFYTRRFPNVIKQINNNVYVVREDGLVPPDDYVRTMRSFNLSFSEIKLPKTPLEYKSGGVNFIALKVEEQYIDFSILEPQLKRELGEARVKVELNSEVISIESDEGVVETNNHCTSYDLVINSTYENPFLGFENFPVDLKYEMCVINLVSAPQLKDHAITIMDGGFVSVYPWQEGIHSFSSVKHTPAFKTNSLDSLNQFVKSWTEEDMASQTGRINKHVDQYLGFEYESIGSFLVNKIKLLKDVGDSREVKTFQKGKCLAVIPGKLDAVAIFLKELNSQLGV